MNIQKTAEAQITLNSKMLLIFNLLGDEAVSFREEVLQKLHIY